MNDERNESRQRLLNDVLREDPGDWEDKEAALSAFRRGQLLRRAGRAGVAVMIAAVATAGVLVLQRHVIKDNPPAVVANVQPSEQSGMPRLTDEELIASFPSNSCFLAEVEGRQILVFFDPGVEERVLHKGLSAITRNR